MAIVRLVNPIDEEVDSRETLNVVLVRQFVLLRGIHLRQNDTVALQFSGGGGVLGRQGLTVTAPGGVELHHHEAVVFDDGGEVPLLQNDDVFVIHLGLLVLLLRVRVEAGEVVEVFSVVFVAAELVGIWVVAVAVVRSGGVVIGFLEEAEIFIVVADVVVLGGFLAESEREGGEEEESGEGEQNDESRTV